MHFDYSFYDTVYQEIRSRGESGWGGNDRLSKAASHISEILHHRCIPKGRRALEVGCGEGNQSRLMASLGYQVTGIDVSATAIAWAREKTPVLPHIEYICGNFAQHNVLPDRQFELILDGACLHCIGGADRDIFFGNVKRLLTEDGVFVVCCLCSKNGQSREESRQGLGLRHIATDQDIMAELVRNRFKILQQERRLREVDDNLLIFAGHQPDDIQANRA